MARGSLTRSTNQFTLFMPESNWERPTELPDLHGVDVVALDLETCDKGLQQNYGPGWAFGAKSSRGGFICGVSAAWRAGSETRTIYVPVRHENSECFDRDAAIRWVRHVMTGRQLVFHNAPYDLGWLMADWGIPFAPGEQLNDTTAMAVMLDENRFSYRLDELAKSRGIEGKQEALLNEAAAASGLKDAKNHMYELAAKYVGPYAEQDALSTLLLYEGMLPDIIRDDVLDAYRLECDLIPMVLSMRKRGIRIDERAVELAMIDLHAKRDEQLRILSAELGETVSMEKIRQVKWMERVFTDAKISFVRTAKTGRGSFTSGKGGWMTKHPHLIPRTISQAKRYDEAANKFIEGFVKEYSYKGRIHANVNQFRSEDGGTRSHRFSYSDPPLQQMPERDEEIGPLVRGLFLPEEGELWGAHDYSQQEYRIIVHAAHKLNCTRAQEAVDLYWDKPKTDFHGLVVEWTGLDRKRAKDCNFAKAFGAGVRKFAEMIGKTEEEAKEIYGQYDRELPFVSEAAKKAEKKAQRGYIKLIDGARCHFDMWEAKNRKKGDAYVPPMPEAQAIERWGAMNIRRSMTHKAFNRFVQGSAARQTKLAMRICWREGLVPLLQMHDELSFSHAEEAAGQRVAEIMRTAVDLAVPMQVDSEYGPNWGAAKLGWAEAQEKAQLRRK